MKSDGITTNWSEARQEMSRRLRQEHLDDLRREGLQEDSEFPPELWPSDNGKKPAPEAEK